MQLDSMDLITIIAEHILREPLIADLRRLGARGYSLGEVEGEGTRGTHATEWQGRNLRIEAIVSRAVSDRVLAHLAETYFANHALIAYRAEVSVMRAEKFR